MKKLALVLAVTVASVFAVNAEPIGIKVGADVYDNYLLTTSSFQINPYASYSKSALGLDLGLKASYWATLTPSFVSEKVQIDLSGSKSFKLSDAFSLTPSLTIRNEIYATGTSYALNLRPGIAGTYGIFTTFVQLQSYMPVARMTETDLVIYLDEYVALGDLGLGGYLYYRAMPTTTDALYEAGVYGTYALGPVGLGLTADFYSFSTKLDMSLIFSISYAF